MNYSWLTINVLVTCLQGIVLTIVFTLHPLSGRGVFALVPFIKGDFVVEYRGEMITLIEAELRREANQGHLFYVRLHLAEQEVVVHFFFFFFFYQYILKLQLKKRAIFFLFKSRFVLWFVKLNFNFCFLKH